MPRRIFLRDVLGWAKQSVASDMHFAIERFERGRMLWRENPELICVLVNGGNWASYDDTNTDTEPQTDPSIVSPGPALYQPCCRFGKLWRTNLDVRQQLNWGVEPEHGNTGQAQDFQHGTMVSLEGTVHIIGKRDAQPVWMQY